MGDGTWRDGRLARRRWSTLCGITPSARSSMPVRQRVRHELRTEGRSRRAEVIRFPRIRRPARNRHLIGSRVISCWSQRGSISTLPRRRSGRASSASWSPMPGTRSIFGSRRRRRAEPAAETTPRPVTRPGFFVWQSRVTVAHDRHRPRHLARRQFADETPRQGCRHRRRTAGRRIA